MTKIKIRCSFFPPKTLYMWNFKKYVPVAGWKNPAPPEGTGPQSVMTKSRRPHAQVPSFFFAPISYI